MTAKSDDFMKWMLPGLPKEETKAKKANPTEEEAESDSDFADDDGEGDDDGVETDENESDEDMPTITINSVEEDDWMKSLPGYKDEAKIHEELAKKYATEAANKKKAPSK